MSDERWSDILLDEFGDFVPDAGGDVSLVSGPAAVAQDVSHRILTAPGTIADNGTDRDQDEAHDPPGEYGAGLILAVHDDLDARLVGDLLGAIEEQVARDRRLLPGEIQTRVRDAAEDRLALSTRAVLLDGTKVTANSEAGG